VAGWVGSTNLGDELVFSALRRRLAALGAGVSAVSVAPAATAADHGVATVDHHDVAGLVRAGRRSAAVVLGGGGLLQDRTSAVNVPYHLARVVPARLAGTPLGVVAIGAGPLQGRGARALVRAALAGSAVVTARDRPSAELLSRLGVQPVEVTADLALSLPLPEAPVADRLVVCLRPWTTRRGRLPVALGRAGEVAPWFVAGAAAALDAAAAATGLAVHFVALQGDRDGPLHDQVAERMSSPATAARPGLDEVVGEVARARVVVAMRYHALVAAVLGGRPALSLGYDPKVDALAGELGPGAVAFGADQAGLAALPAAVEALAGAGHEAAEAAVADARGRLRLREEGNGAALERLLSA